MTQRVYYDDGTPPWTWWHTKGIDLDHTSAEVAHGYTLCSLDRLSRIAARRTFGGHISYTDRYWLAYSAMSEHLLAAEGPPTSRDLLARASRAIVDHQVDDAHHHGWSQKKKTTQVNYLRYWDWAAGVVRSHEPRIVERVALAQIWPRLREVDRQTLTALAATGDRQTAAQSLGITPAAFKRRLQNARKAFLRWWHEGEQPSHSPWRHDRRKGRPHDQWGRARLTAAQVEEIRERVWRGETYQQVAADYGVSKMTVHRHLRGFSAAVGGEAA